MVIRLRKANIEISSMDFLRDNKSRRVSQPALIMPKLKLV